MKRFLRAEICADKSATSKMIDKGFMMNLRGSKVEMTGVRTDFQGRGEQIYFIQKK